MELLKRLYRRASTGPATASEAVEALLNGGSLEAFLEFAAGETAGTSSSEISCSAVLLSHIESDDRKRVRSVVRLLAKDTREAAPEDTDDELGTAQAYHPFGSWLLKQPEKEPVRQILRSLLRIVGEESQASLYYTAESALAAITDAAHQRGSVEVLLSLADEFMDVVCARLTDGVHLHEDGIALEEDDLEDARYGDEFTGDHGEPHQLTSIAEAVLMLLNSRVPSNNWFFYPGWNPGTLVFVLERLFGLFGDDHEIEHPRLNALIERTISLLHGEHNLRAHVAGNAACALSQLCRTKGGMARVLTHPSAESMSVAIGALLSAKNLPANNYTVRIVTKWVGNLAEAEEGAPWLFARPREIKVKIMSTLMELLVSEDFQTATEASHALAQLLLFSEPDTAEGDEQRSFLYGLEASKGLAAALAGLMQAGADPAENDGPLQPGHSDRYIRGYAAAEEACVIVAEMIYDKEGSDLLLTAAPELVEAVYGLLSSRDPDCAIAGANVLSRMADLSNLWGEHLQPTEEAVTALTALLAHQSAHRHALPALSKVLGVKGWLHALLRHEKFGVLVAWLVSELEPQEGLIGSAATASSSGATDAEAAWAAGTLATIAGGSPEGASALLEGPHGHDIVARLLVLLRRRDTRHAAAAALGPLQASSEGVREQLLRTVEGRGDGVSLALLESSGVEPVALDEQLRMLDLAEKRSWLATRLHHLHNHLSLDVAALGFPGPLELECQRDSLLESLCAEHSRGAGLAGDLRHGVIVKFAGETGQGAAIRREWFALTAQELLDPSHGLFVSRNSGQSYQPSPAASVACDDPEQYMEVAGRVTGLALLHAVPFDCEFTRAFLRQLLEQDVCVDDMEEMDPVLYRHKIRFLLDNPYPDFLELAFTDCGDDTGVVDRDVEVELVPGGSLQPVTEDNKKEYIDALVRWRLTCAIEGSITAFKRGLHAVVPRELLERMSGFVDPMELSTMIVGLKEIDVQDWKANTRYEGEAMSSGENQQVTWFWALVEGFSEAERKALLQFTTGSSNLPVGGFSRLQSGTGTLHPFTLSELTGRAATNTLPRAAACFNTLYLPAFDSMEQMKERLKIAVGMGGGHFDENAVSIGRGPEENGAGGSVGSPAPQPDDSGEGRNGHESEGMLTT
uniref:HECT-type E3 ubiquitin transferase n=2 Tax=Tetraselmis sp. GSL018 TaxID=582737 RepID=A0A061SF93_9CHLO|mmetsp:Transcript_9142/g.22022  ORF Transcript_9142/g.22022 Transcript_9142/m.22022 type:complete len:1141 (-) Transcript_9142:281-3703(-)|eukprot:CAMPEP_0177590976 /NCGR_PEP_ID=MMETSP0419_2-20121207/7720_1 /TAXON_ID=582737 /ORGANISM="Tetraselmis sp., Strain GSL018" /LENGTH=1140 /DNA_ID=CAMNT_0019081625 /DNA_START=77 /DNA_END=3499 /DNA_ORIENTATION=-